LSLHLHISTPQLGPLKEAYLISKLACHWEQAGHRISTGPEGLGDADLGILHIDRTRISPLQLPENPRGVPLLNGRVLDISKDRYSMLRVLPGDAWDGPVILKSVLNAFGYQEWRSTPRGVFGLLRRELAKRHWEWARRLPPNDYPVLPRLSQVPAWAWEDPDLIVERFMPEREGEYFCIRGWLFFGDRGYTYRIYSHTGVVKVGSMVKYEILGDPPPELEAFRRSQGFDFGKFDYVLVEGQPVVLDINKTPMVSAGPDSPRLRELAEGLYCMMSK